MSSPRPLPSSQATEYVYRRDLGPRELLPAVALGVGAGLAAFYVARVLLERTPLVPRGARRGPRGQGAGQG